MRASGNRTAHHNVVKIGDWLTAMSSMPIMELEDEVHELHHCVHSFSVQVDLCPPSLPPSLFCLSLRRVFPNVGTLPSELRG